MHFHVTSIAVRCHAKCVVREIRGINSVAGVIACRVGIMACCVGVKANRASYRTVTFLPQKKQVYPEETSRMPVPFFDFLH